MAKKDLFDSIDVPDPCPQSWDAMHGEDKARFCANCEKDIYNFSAMTRNEAKKLLQSKESVCVRIEKSADGKIKTLKKQFHQITRRIPIAAGVLSASLTITAVATAQKRPPPPRPPQPRIGRMVVTPIPDTKSTASVSGIIADISGAIIPNAQIILRDAKSKKYRRTTSNEEGFYEFKTVAASVYEIEVKATKRFRQYLNKNVKISGDKKLDLPIVLETATRQVKMGILQ